MKNHLLELRLAELILTRTTFTADDLTDAGTITLDANHQPNGGQSGIGAFINSASRRALIQPTGEIAQSQAPHRKGGMIRIWAPTEAGHLWAVNEAAK